MRSDAREAAFKIVFASLFHEDSDKRFHAELYRRDKLSKEECEFAESLVSCVFEHREELLALLSEKVQRFADYRIFAADKAILLIALAEIRYFEEIPPVVSVNEAASLARKYSTEKSTDFVNGVLGSFINK